MAGVFCYITNTFHCSQACRRLCGRVLVSVLGPQTYEIRITNSSNFGGGLRKETGSVAHTAQRASIPTLFGFPNDPERCQFVLASCALTDDFKV